MKFCNIFLAVAVFLSVGIAFAVAEEPIDGEPGRETVQTSGSDQVITLSRYRDIAGTESRWTSYSAGKKHVDIKALLETTFAPYRTDDELQVYEFAISFDNSITKTIGVTERNDSYQPSVFPDAGAESSDGSPSSDNGAYAILVYEKKVFRDGMNRPKTMSGGFYGDNIKEEDDVSKSPLSTPILLLVFMLTFCIILIISTTVGIKLND